MCWLRNACAASLAVWLFNGQSAEIGPPRLITAALTNLAGQTVSGGTSLPVVSADGTRVAFMSRAPNLLTNAENGSYQVFLRELASGRVSLVSASSSTAGGNDHSTLPSVSSNGLWIAFESEASDLVSSDTNEVSDIFLRDVAGSETVLVSGGNGPSRSPMISADGRYVAFESRASDLVQGDTNRTWDVFMRDMVLGVTMIVSANTAGIGTANRGSELLGLTPDGQYVAFWSDATDISDETTNTLGEIYVRDLRIGVTYCLTESISTPPGQRRFEVVLTPDGQFAGLHQLSDPGPSGQPGSPEAGRIYWADVFGGSVTNLGWGRPARGLAISDDGSLIVFYGRDNFQRDNFFLRDLSVQTNKLLVSSVTDIGSFQVSGDFQRLWFTLMASNRGYQLLEYDFATGQTHLVSTNALGLAINSGVFSPFCVSESGAVLAFETAASDLVPHDLNRAPDVFVVGRGLVAARHPELPERTGSGIGTLWPGNISANGHRVAFASTDSSLTAYDTNGYGDLFIIDLPSNGIVNVDGLWRSSSVSMTVLSADGFSIAFERFVGLAGQRRGDLFRADLRVGETQQLGTSAFVLPSWNPSLSQEGRWLALQDGGRIRVLDLRMPQMPGMSTNQMVDVRYDNTSPGNGVSSNATIGLNGEWVAFASRATDLIQPGADGGFGTPYPSGVTQAFARNLRTQRSRLVSITDEGNPLPTGASSLALSANGRFAIFQTAAAQTVYRHDLSATGRVTNALVCSNCSQPSISDDGLLIAYRSQEGQIYVKDILSGASELLGGTQASEPTISLDGRFVVFVSRESWVSQIYVRDRWTGNTHLISRNYLDGSPGNAPSSRPVMSHDGRTIAFQSFASDLVPGDYNGRRDIFVVQIAPVDTDGDGMDDDWEQFHFGSLTRDGTENFDGDHLTDAAEFFAGTNPVDASSSLQLTSISSRMVPGFGQDTEMRWTSAAGKVYRLQHKADLDAPWMELPLDIMTGGPNGSGTHLDAGGTGFYKIRLVE